MGRKRRGGIGRSRLGPRRLLESPRGPERPRSLTARSAWAAAAPRPVHRPTPADADRAGCVRAHRRRGRGRRDRLPRSRWGGSSGVVTAMKDAAARQASPRRRCAPDRRERKPGGTRSRRRATRTSAGGRLAPRRAVEPGAGRAQPRARRRRDQYGDKVPAETVTLRSFYDASPNGLLLAPLPKLGRDIALSVRREPDVRRAETRPRHPRQVPILTTRRSASFSPPTSKAPERIPLENLAPGT